MARISDDSKHARKERIWLCVKRHPRGITELEVADYAGLERRTVNNYLNELESEGKLFKEGTLWLPLDYDETRLRSIELQPEEAVALYLGARLLVKQSDKRNEPVETALHKLAQELTSGARVGDEIVQAARELAGRPVQPGYQPVFQTVVRGYIYRRQVALRYHPLNAPPFETRFSTYLIEPSPVGFATYLIGHSQVSGGLRSYKLERIEAAHLTADPYTIPPDFPGLAVLKNAWSIMLGEARCQVILRFSPQVSRRVQETTWHPSQATAPDPDRPGWLRWSAEVADTLDMLPWVRGWGSDVEVLAPEELRETLRREAERLMELYQMDEMNKLLGHLRKKDKKPQSLSEHLRAVSILTGKFTDKIGLKRIGELLGLLHDIGKASREFQNYIRSATGLLSPDEDEYIDAKGKKGKVDHSSAGAQIVYRRLANRGSEGLIAAQILSLCIASHHSGLIDCLSPDGENNFQRRIEKTDEQTHADEALKYLEESENEKFNELLAEPEKQLVAKLNTIKEDNDSIETRTFKFGLLIRFLFSCLIDADRLDTADFEFPSNAQLRNYGQYPAWEVLIQRLDKKIEEFRNKPQKNEIDELRNQVSDSCFAFSEKPRGIYQLKVPTGGGKTLASLRFALNHAARHKMDRIFYIIPYTSIIDQNAEEVRKILEDKDFEFRQKVVRFPP